MRPLGEKDGRYRNYYSRHTAIRLVLVLVGFAGTLFGNLIKSAVSRQREFLADASAVQFTRNPTGIADALKKIGGYQPGSQIQATHAAEYSHMFFSRAIGGAFSSLMATHRWSSESAVCSLNGTAVSLPPRPEPAVEPGSDEPGFDKPMSGEAKLQ